MLDRRCIRNQTGVFKYLCQSLAVPAALAAGHSTTNPAAKAAGTISLHHLSFEGIGGAARL